MNSATTALLISMLNKRLFQSKERRLSRINPIFVLSVVFPTLLAILYYGLIASDVYISESRFVIRSSKSQATSSSALGVFLQGTGLYHSLDDTYMVKDFLLSRDALFQMNNHLGLAQHYGCEKVDLISRFGGLDWDTSFEALYKYYQKKVVIDLEAASSIITLDVRAFSAETAYQINAMLLDMGEALVNRLNERARQDMIRFAAAEVSKAESKVKDAALALCDYRTKKGVFDPPRQSGLQLQGIIKLQDELIATKTLLVQVRTVSRDNPQIPVLQKRIETLEGAIGAETGKVAGNEQSLSKKTSEYERLVLEQTFTDKQLAATLASLEQARNEAQRKQLYLVRVVQPHKPDVAVEPKRVRMVLAIFMLGVIVWGVLNLLIAGVREHFD